MPIGSSAKSRLTTWNSDLSAWRILRLKTINYPNVSPNEQQSGSSVALFNLTKPNGELNSGNRSFGRT